MFLGNLPCLWRFFKRLVVTRQTSTSFLVYSTEDRFSYRNNVSWNYHKCRGDTLMFPPKLGKISAAWVLSNVLNSSSFGNPRLCMASCCYAYCNQFCDWRTYFNTLSVIGWCNCLIISVQLDRPSGYTEKWRSSHTNHIRGICNDIN